MWTECIWESALKRIFELMRDEVRKVWTKLHNEELHKTHSLLSQRERDGRSMWHEWERAGTRIVYWWGSQRDREHQETQNGGWVMLIWILEL
jgi:hypothetical protein